MRLRNKKTGEIVDGSSVYSIGGNIILKTEDHSYVFSSLEKLNRFFEDYNPTEPLIKDKKIRKAVRAWADANNSTKMVFDGYHLASDENGNDIEFSNSWAENVIHGEWYTIAELCGEEEYSSARQLAENICEVMDKERRKNARAKV